MYIYNLLDLTGYRKKCFENLSLSCYWIPGAEFAHTVVAGGGGG